MSIFLVGIGMFVAGAVLNALGWWVHRRTIKGAPEEFFSWLLDVFKEWFKLHTDRHSTLGERIAAVGAIISALGLVTAVSGLLVWAV